MLINLRNALMAGKRLPYDAEVEYLESTGTQYIDTGISGAEQNLIITAGVRINAFTAYAGAFGNYAAESANSFRLILTGSNNGQAYANCGYITSSSHIITNFSLGNWHTIILNGTEDRCFCDGVEYTKGNRYIQGTANANTIRIFTSGGPAAGTWSKQVSAFKIELNGVTIRDYIPVRVGTVGYLYDRVTRKLFGNAGTGDFVLGPDVVPVEYIESHGTEYIDTGLLGRDGYDFEYRFRPIGPLPLGIGGEYESNKNCYIGLVRSNGYLAYNYYYPNNIVEVQSLTLGTDYDIKAHLYSDGQYFEVNGVRGGVGSRTGAFTSSYSLYLFAINNANQPANLGVMRLYNFTAHLNTIPTRSFRPVRVGTEGAMMDTLTRRIYRNAGAGAFTYGNDLKYPIPAE